MLQQMDEDVEHLRLHRHNAAGSPQLLLHKIDFIWAEAKAQVSLPNTDAARTRPVGERAHSDRRCPRRTKRYHDFRNLQRISRRIMTRSSWAPSAAACLSLDSPSTKHGSVHLKRIVCRLTKTSILCAHVGRAKGHRYDDRPPELSRHREAIPAASRDRHGSCDGCRADLSEVSPSEWPVRRVAFRLSSRGPHTGHTND